MCDGNGSYLTTKNRKQQEPFRESNNDISQTQKMRWKRKLKQFCLLMKLKKLEMLRNPMHALD